MIWTPDWQIAQALRNPQAGLEPTLADIESRMPAGHVYRDSRHVTWAHETTHGLNARLRNQRVELVRVHYALEGGVPNYYALPRPAGDYDLNVSLGNVNAAYCLEGRYLLLPEPSCRLSQIAQAVPQSWRGMSYQLYLVQQQRYWDGQPLYVLDEWTAYLNGLATALDAQGGDGQYSDVLQAVEFFGYGMVLLAYVSRLSYGSLAELQRIVGWLGQRTRELYQRAKGTRLDSGKLEQHWRAIQEDQSARQLRDWIKQELGNAWYADAIAGTEYHGLF